MTPLHCAAMMGNTNCAKVLVAKGANVNMKDKVRTMYIYVY